MKLEIKHLAPYLPYGLKLYGASDIWTMHSLGIENIEIYNGLNLQELSFDDCLCDYKPLLHPLSDLTKEITVDNYNDGKSFVPYCMIEDLGLAESVSLGFARVVFSFNKYYGISISERLSFIEYDLKEEIDKINKLPYSIIKLLYQWHFDVENLIGQNLAIDINQINQ